MFPLFIIILFCFFFIHGASRFSQGEVDPIHPTMMTKGDDNASY